MWESVVLSGLVDGPAQTQARLAEAVGRDKTRIIPILDALEARGLLVRSPRPGRPSQQGRGAHRAGPRAAGRRGDGHRRGEEEVLGPLDAAERRTFRELLGRLYEDARPTIT